jgi:hypothetical protein
MDGIIGGARRSDLQPVAFLQAIQQRAIAAGEPPPTQPRVGDEQAVERIARPAKIDRLRKPRPGRRVVERPPRVIGERANGAAFEADLSRFEEKLQLQQIGW